MTQVAAFPTQMAQGIERIINNAVQDNKKCLN